MDIGIKDVLDDIIFDTKVTAKIYSIVDYYYQEYIGNSSDYFSSGILHNADWPGNQELYDGVEKRTSGIGQAIVTLLDSGYGIDVPDDSFNALMLAVGYGDYQMTRFLLEHGSNPNVWPYMEEDITDCCQNYYLEDIDIHYNDEFFEKDSDLNYMEALKKTAEVLVKIGKLKSFNGLCLLVTDDGKISFEMPRMRY